MWALLSLVLSVSSPASTVEEEAESLYAKGVELYNAGEFDQAVDVLSRAAALRSDVPDYRYHLGLAYLKVGRAREAASELEAALGMMGLNRSTRVLEPMVLVEAAMAYLQLSKTEIARARVELALKRGEDSPDAHYVLGLVEAADGHEEKAMDEFREALARDRDHPDANLALAERLVRQGNIAEAREDLRHAWHARPESFEIAMMLGQLAFQDQDQDLAEAEEAFALAHRVRPDDDGAAYDLGTVLLSRGKQQEAIAVFQPLVERPLPQDSASFNLAQAYRQSGELEKARDLLRALLQRQPDFEGASFALALTLESLSDLAGAEEAYRAAIDRRPDDLPAFLNLAALLERSDRRSEARALLQKALEIPMDEERAKEIREAIGRLDRR